MQLQDAYPIVVTDKLSECRDFYTRALGFDVVFEASWFVYLSSPGERSAGIAFMAAHHPSQPPGPRRSPAGECSSPFKWRTPRWSSSAWWGRG
jgi:catechol 2,3-dioxygenase-like lactoylglutathione lyase family enzyme